MADENRNIAPGIESILPERDVRLLLLKDMADFIRKAHENNPASWCISFPKGRGYGIKLFISNPFFIKLSEDHIDLLVDVDALRYDLKRFLHTEDDWQLRRFPEVQFIGLSTSQFLEYKDALEPARLAAFEKYKDSSRRINFYKSHDRSIVEYISSAIGEKLPQPDFFVIDLLLERMRSTFPGWKSFRDPQFESEEINYKWRTIEEAKILLAEGDLRRLLEENDFDELENRFITIGRGNNLLYQSIPMQGDLSILYQPELDKGEFYPRLIDLIHGEGDVESRFGRYLEYVEAVGLPNKWTFPTYYLFITHPEAEYFVKPSTTGEYLKLAGYPHLYQSKPNAQVYSDIKSVAGRTMHELSEFGPRDMVDIQSFMWVVARADMEEEKLIPERKLLEFDELFSEFVHAYPSSKAGKEHIELYASGRRNGKQNYSSVLGLEASGKDVTAEVLLKLLPHPGNATSIKDGAWIFVAPPGTSNFKNAVEGAGWIRPEDWPEVTRAILKFIRSCEESSENLAKACSEFANNSVRGFQSAMLTPILNAVHPEWYLLVNSKVTKVMGYLTEKDYSRNLIDYPAVNATLFEIVDLLSDSLSEVEGMEYSTDVFDMFCHWLVAEKKHPLRKTQYWKIAPGENARNWDACLKNGYIALGWDEIGDLTGLSRTEYEERRDSLISKYDDWTKTGMEQLWRFTKQINEGDYIVANKGTSEVLGIGIASGDYYYDDESEHAHRIPVEWIDLTPFRVDQGGWRRTLIKLDRSTFDEILRMESTTPESEGGGVSLNPLSSRAFELLEGLDDNPTKAFYDEHKVEMQNFLINPFRELFSDVISGLSSLIADEMETEKGIYSRIPKNDYGKGGAWNFYWGAIYPIGEKRINSPQLYLSIYSDFLKYGYYIGDYGEQFRNTFLQNCRVSEPVISRILSDISEIPGIRFGADAEFSFDEWINKAGANPYVSIRIHKDDIFAMSTDDITSRVTEAFQVLYPLVILAVSENPLSVISSYLGDVEPEELNAEYSIQDIVNETGFTEDQVQRWISAVDRKKQCILYGPPGTGKTYLAERIGKHLLSGGNGIIDLVQFHPSYAYEDFMQGLRPQVKADGNLEYRNIPGRFIEFCREASKAEGPSVLIIDEINRANLSSVFGELMYLLEYRDKKIPLAGGRKFSIPANVYIVGTMNTADRSIALVDHALRRRFAFIHLAPDYRILEVYHERESTGFDVSGLVGVLKDVNNAINDRNYELGITFFLDPDIEEHMEDIWKLEIEPYLEEYFFDKPDQAYKYKWQNVNNRIMS